MTLSSGIVHVYDESVGACRPALVLDVQDRPDKHEPQLLLRVIHPTGLGGKPGDDDGEGWYPHHADAFTYGVGTHHERRGDSWHAIDWPGRHS